MTQWHFTAPAPAPVRPPVTRPISSSAPSSPSLPFSIAVEREARGIGDRERKGEKQKGTATEQLIRWDAGTGRVRVSAFIFVYCFLARKLAIPAMRDSSSSGFIPRLPFALSYCVALFSRSPWSLRRFLARTGAAFWRFVGGDLRFSLRFASQCP